MGKNNRLSCSYPGNTGGIYKNVNYFSFKEEIIMKLGVFSPVLAQSTFKEMIEYLASQGVQQVEMGAGGYMQIPVLE